MGEHVDDEPRAVLPEEVIWQKDDFFTKARAIASAIRGQSNHSTIATEGEVMMSWTIPNGYALAMYEDIRNNTATVMKYLGGTGLSHEAYPIGETRDYSKINPLILRSLTAVVDKRGTTRYLLRTEVDADDYFKEVHLFDDSIFNDIEDCSFEVVRVDDTGVVQHLKDTHEA